MLKVIASLKLCVSFSKLKSDHVFNDNACYKGVVFNVSLLTVNATLESVQTVYLGHIQYITYT